MGCLLRCRLRAKRLSERSEQSSALAAVRLRPLEAMKATCRACPGRAVFSDQTRFKKRYRHHGA